MSYEGAGTYRHYKGGRYYVLGIAEHTEERGKYFVVYRQLTAREEALLVRPLEMFNDTVCIGHGVNVPRFTLLTRHMRKRREKD